MNFAGATECSFQTAEKPRDRGSELRLGFFSRVSDAVPIASTLLKPQFPHHCPHGKGNIKSLTIKQVSCVRRHTLAGLYNHTLQHCRPMTISVLVELQRSWTRAVRICLRKPVNLHGFRAQYCDVRCDSLERNTLCTATKPSSDAYDYVDGLESELSSPDGGAAALWRFCLVWNLCRNFSEGISAPEGTVCNSGVEDLKPHGRGRELFAAVHDICGVTCTCGVAEVVDAGCSNLPSLANEPAKASTADGACSYSWPHGAACDVRCDCLERNTLCTATKPSFAA